MPRARTQSGNASCADTLSELAVDSHPMPAMNMAKAATGTLGENATTAVAMDCRSVPRITMVSRDMRLRRRGRIMATKTAPVPIDASSSVNVPAPPPCKLRATSGSKASSAVEWKKNRATRSNADFRRADCRTNCVPTRIALNRRSRPRGLGTCSRRHRMMTKPVTTDSTALSTNT